MLIPDKFGFRMSELDVKVQQIDDRQKHRNFLNAQL